NLSLDKVFKLVQLALVKRFNHADHFLDLGINFSLEEDYELALMCFDMAIVFDKDNWLAYYWKAESYHQKLKIESRKKYYNQFVIDELYRHDVITIIEYYKNLWRCSEKNYEQIPSIHNKINLARASSLLGNYIAKYVAWSDGQGRYCYKNILWTDGFSNLCKAQIFYQELDFLNCLSIATDDRILMFPPG
ncbi:MAG: hypothetical protein ACLBM6_07875, partial [Cuspidothrix sp.]